MTTAGDTPAAIALTVVVPSVNGWSDLEGAVAALVREAEQVSLEVLVVDRLGDGVQRALRERFPQVTLLPVPPDTTIPAMRLAAFDAARGASVAVIEDHVIVPPGWARAMLEAQRSSPVVGGAVANAATGTTVDWAAFLCEYSHCLPPIPAGPSDWLTGNNVIYPRALLQRYRARLGPEQWENHLHDLLRADGVVLMCHPEIVVGHKKHYTVWEYFSQRYLYARSYAGARVLGAPLAKRLFFGAAAAALPPVLFARTVGRIRSKGQHLAELRRSLPLIAVFVCAWAAGEVVGAWFGAGRSLQQVR